MQVSVIPPDTIRGAFSAAGSILKAILLRRIQDFGHPKVEIIDRDGGLENQLVFHFCHIHRQYFHE